MSDPQPDDHDVLEPTDDEGLPRAGRPDQPPVEPDEHRDELPGTALPPRPGG